MTRVDLVGRCFGRLTVIARVASRGNGYRWLCRCACGTEKEVDGDHLTSERTRSCGCLSEELRRSKATTRGHRAARSPTYVSWEALSGRCFCATNKSFADYGGRGITVCERWRGPGGFENFLADMGERPEGATLDRIDNDRGYEPGNCRWATRTEQNRNQRSTKFDATAAVQVRWLVAEGGYSRRAVARAFGVSHQHVSSIVHGRAWSDCAKTEGF